MFLNYFRKDNSVEVLNNFSYRLRREVTDFNLSKVRSLETTNNEVNNVKLNKLDDIDLEKLYLLNRLYRQGNYFYGKRVEFGNGGFYCKYPMWENFGLVYPFK